jgi:type IV pilus assembly protein PilE
MTSANSIASPYAPRRARRGITLIELMIAVAIVAIIAAVAFPAYSDSMRKSRRSEAFGALSNVQQLQERWRSNNATYAASLTNGPTDSPPGLGMSSARTGNGLYDLAVSGTSATGYVISAAAVAGGRQEGDGNCKVLAVQMNAATLRYGSAATVADLNWSLASPDIGRCWARQ